MSSRPPVAPAGESTEVPVIHVDAGADAADAGPSAIRTVRTTTVHAGSAPAVPQGAAGTVAVTGIAARRTWASDGLYGAATAATAAASTPADAPRRRRVRMYRPPAAADRLSFTAVLPPSARTGSATRAATVPRRGLGRRGIPSRSGRHAPSRGARSAQAADAVDPSRRDTSFAAALTSRAIGDSQADGKVSWWPSAVITSTG